MAKGVVRCGPPSKLVFYFWGSYDRDNFGENWSRNVTVRVLADRYTDTPTDANRFYNPSHAICHSHGADNYLNYTKNIFIILTALTLCKQNEQVKSRDTENSTYRQVVHVAALSVNLHVKNCTVFCNNNAVLSATWDKKTYCS